MTKINLGISSCLLGHDVRWDGTNRFNDLIEDVFGTHARMIPACPEYECGLGVPREPMELAGSSEDVRMVTLHTSRDHTQTVSEWSKKRSEELEMEDISGFIFKSGSPSCGVRGVRVRRRGKKPLKSGIGLFAQVYRSRFPKVPVTDEKFLLQPNKRMAFVENIFVLRRFREIVTDEDLKVFHSDHRLTLTARSRKKTEVLEKLVPGRPIPEVTGVLSKYTSALQDILKLAPTRSKNIRILRSVATLLGSALSASEREELDHTLTEYGNGRTSLAAVLLLLGYIVRKHDHEDLAGRFFTNRHPLELSVMEDV